MEVKLYTTSSCPYCQMAKDWFKKNNISYQEFNVSLDEERRNEMIEKSGQMAVPVIDVNGQIVVGFDKNRLAKLLDLD
jgi:glutaredoxin-like YruB-family protein